MDIQGEYHPEIVYLLPAIIVGESVCDCCEGDGPTVLSLSLLVWSLHFVFGAEGADRAMRTPLITSQVLKWAFAGSRMAAKGVLRPPAPRHESGIGGALKCNAFARKCNALPEGASECSNTISTGGLA